MISQRTAINPRPKLPLLGVQDQARAPWWPRVLWVVWKKDARPDQALRDDLGPPSPRVPGACECSDYPICKLQSRLSASASEIRDPYLCLLPPEPGRPELNLVQTLWHHRADYWGNLLLCWDHCEEGSDDFQLRKEGKKKKKKEHTTTAAVSSIGVVRGKSGASLRCHRFVQAVTHGAGSELLGWVDPHGLLQLPFGSVNS